MSAQDCIDDIRKATGEDFSDDKLDEILTLLERRSARKMKDDPTLSKDKALHAAAAELVAEKKLAALIEKRNRAINVMRREALLDYIGSSKMKPSDALKAKVYGKEGGYFGAGESTDAKINALRHSLRGALLNDLEKAGMLAVFKKKDPDFEVNVAREMSRLNGAKGVEATADTNVRTLAEILTKHGENARLMQNDAGAYIRKMEGYVTRQSHDQLKIEKAGFKKWKADILPLLDERTFDDVDNVDRYLKEMHARLATGQHIKVNGDSDFLGGFKGSQNLAKKASAERVLHFKSADDWMKYNASYGRGSLFEAVLDGIDYGARNTAVMRDWGTNPEAMFEGLRERLIKNAEKEGDTQEMKRLSNWFLTASFRDLTNAVDLPGSARMAQVGSTVRILQSMAKLGGVVLSSFPDLAVKASVLKHNGVNFLEAYGNGLSSFFQGRKGTETREIANLIGVGLDGMTGDMFRQMHAMDSTPGRLSKVANTFFKMTGLTFWQDAQARGVGLMLSHNLARNQKAAFGALDARLQTTLSRYGIGEREWAVFQKMETRAADGRDYITADAVASVSDADIAAYLGKADAKPRAINAARRDLGAKLDTYYLDQVREALTIAGAKERTAATMNTSAGTPLGEAVRFVMQFKTYPITFISRSIGREMNRGDAFTIGHLIAGTTALGYLSMTTKELAKGREPREPEGAVDWVKLMAASMKQGGGLGIYGDFLFGDANRVGGSWGSTLLGPTFGGTLGDIEKVFNAAKRGVDPSATAFRGVLANTPFANLFYTRVAADYLFLYAIQEQLNPGFLRRYERQIERDNNQRFLLPPSNYDRDPVTNAQRLLGG